MRPTTHNIKTDLLCAYCGQTCADNTIEQNGNTYCCFGCATIHNVVDLKIDSENIPVQYRQYDLPDVFNQLVEFASENQYRIRLHAPNIHCASCVLILEDLPVLDERIIRTNVNFEERSIVISAKREMNLSELAYLLDRLGYPPHFDQQNSVGTKLQKSQRQLITRIAVVGFCFGNSMLFSLPHYLGLELANDIFFSKLFTILNLVLSFVVILYGAQEYLSSAIKAISIKKSHINIPIAIGLVAIWGWSLYEVTTQQGFGYFDSLAGLIFFLLVGKWFQNKVYKQVTYERSLHDLLPLSVRLQGQNGFEWKSINDLESGDLICVKNGEVVPVSGALIEGEARIDYSFVTGESKPQKLKIGETIYIGGKQILGDITIKLTTKPNPETIWSAWKTPKKEETHQHWTNQVSAYFTPAILTIAVVAALVWWTIMPSKALFVFSSVLIVACPCALALSSPFTYGSIQRYFSRNGLYLKSTDNISKIKDLNHIVFDKTGTLTRSGVSEVSVVQNDLTLDEESMVKSVAINSNHEVSKWLANHLSGSRISAVSELNMVNGLGVSGIVNHHEVKIGSGQFFNLNSYPEQTHVYVAVDHKIKALFSFGNVYKPQLSNTLNMLGARYKLSVLSGDNTNEKKHLQSLYPNFEYLQFNSRPEDKMHFMENLHKDGDSAMMIGDGLNDQVALTASDLGIVVTENINGFYPNADGVLMANQFEKLPRLMALGTYSKRVLWTSLTFSILYNGIGISFAVTGLLNPLIAAILMPLSSITVVGLVTAMVSHKAHKLELS